MSRRSRKRGKGSGGNKWLVGLVVVVLLLMVSFGVLHMMIRRYLQSDEFRVFLSKKVGESISVNGEFKPLIWDGLSVRSDGFEAEGNEQLRLIDIRGLRTEIGLGGFWRGVWEVEGFEIREVDLEIDARSGVAPAIKKHEQDEQGGKPKASKKRWLPSEVEMQSMKIGRMSVKALLDSGPMALKGVQVDAIPGAGRQTYEVKLTGGELSLPNERVPKLRMEEVNLKYKDGAVFVSHAEAGFWDKGRIELTGEWDPALDVRGAQGSVSGVTCDQLVSEDWSKRIQGKVSTDFDVAWVAGEPVASGHLVLQNGVLTALPILEVMEAYLDTTRFRVLTLNEAHTDWRWRNGRWSIHNFVIASEGLMRLEGEMHVVGENLDGNFRLGIAPGTLALIPGAEKQVFVDGERGLRWAPIRVTGTLSEPKHDLTDRLIEAAGRRLLEALPEATMESIRLGTGIIDGSSREAIEQGLKLLDGGTGGGRIDKTVEDGIKGVLDRVLGGGL